LEQSEGVRELVLVLSAEHTRDNDVWEQTAQMQAGRAKRQLRTLRPAPKDPPERQAELVREAAASGAVVLLVEPVDPKTIGPALEEARDKGVPIVLLDRAVEVRGKPLPVVEFAPLEKATRDMVDASIKAAKKSGAPPEGPARLIVPVGADDARMRECRDTLKQVLKDAGIRVLPDVLVPLGDSPEKIIRAMVREKPRPSMVFSTEDNLLANAGMAWGPEQVQGLPVLAGYVADRTKAGSMIYGGCAAVVSLDIAHLAEKAVDTALAMARGETVPDHVVVPLELQYGDTSRRFRMPTSTRPIPGQPPPDDAAK
jgi:ABC-type sugar transport system substrate-binding protein